MGKFTCLHHVHHVYLVHLMSPDLPLITWSDHYLAGDCVFTFYKTARHKKTCSSPILLYSDRLFFFCLCRVTVYIIYIHTASDQTMYDYFLVYPCDVNS